MLLCDDCTHDICLTFFDTTISPFSIFIVVACGRAPQSMMIHCCAWLIWYSLINERENANFSSCSIHSVVGSLEKSVYVGYWDSDYGLIWIKIYLSQFSFMYRVRYTAIGYKPQINNLIKFELTVMWKYLDWQFFVLAILNGIICTI